MRLSIRAKQIAGVTAIVGATVVLLSALYVARLANVIVDDSDTRAETLARSILHRVSQVPLDSKDPYASLKNDPGLKSILEASIYDQAVTSAAVVDSSGTIVMHREPGLVGQPAPARGDLRMLADAGWFEKLKVIYSGDGETLEARQLMVVGNEAFGSIRVGVSTLLMRRAVTDSVRPAMIVAAIALLVTVFVAALLAQIVLRPIHVIRSGLNRLGRGEFGVTLDLPPGDEFSDLGTFFNAVSKQLSADRDVAHADPKRLLESTLAYSRKLVALGRLTAGIAHEVKNPLNAMMIHLELLRTKIRKASLVPAGAGAAADAARLDEGLLQHVQVIESEIRRLDEVVQGFLKFTRPEDLRLQPVRVTMLFEEILPVVQPEADKYNVKVIVDCPDDQLSVNGDASMLRQGFLNLAINACQAMPDGGTLRLSAAPAARDRVELRVEDTGVGIPPEHLDRIFDLYFTTKDHGTGIGLSMVYRIIQMHDGEVEVESTPGRGTTFRVLLPRAE